MAQLRQKADELANRNITVIVVGPEKREAFKKFWERESMPFIGLPDPERTVMKRYGQEVKLLKLGRMPAQILIDTTGTIRAVHYGESMADIADVETMTKALDSD